MSPPAISSRRKLREGARPAFAVFAAVFLATALFTFTRPKLYEATAMVFFSGYFRIHHHDHPVAATEIQSSFASAETFKKVVESDYILRRIAEHLPSALRARLSATQTDEILNELRASREAAPEQWGNDLLTRIACRHREPNVAADLANAFAAATRDYLITRRQEDEEVALKSLEEVLTRAHREANVTASALAQLDLPEDARRKLETTLPTQRSIAEQIARRLDEARAAVRSEQNWLRVTPATPPAAGTYVSPNHLLDLTVGLLIGGIAAAATSHTLRLRRRKPAPVSP